MTDSLKDIEMLIGKSVSGNATPSERKELESWIAASDTNRKIYKQTRIVWKKSTNALSTHQIEDDRINVHLKVNKQLQSKIAKSSKLVFIYKLAAILIIPIALAISWYFVENFNNSLNENQSCEITSPKGNVAKCVLPDGTKVWVNTGSTISYNTTTFNTEKREVNLNGEAYFHVSGNIQKPFIVTTVLGTVKVTGTEFNVKSYSTSKKFETVLENGSVELCFNSNRRQSIILVPGERALYNSKLNKITIAKVDAELYSSWRNGEIIFKDATLNDLVVELERIYDIKFCLEDKNIGEFRFRGMFRYNNNLIDALEKIKKTADLEYLIENKKVKLFKN